MGRFTITPENKYTHLHMEGFSMMWLMLNNSFGIDRNNKYPEPEYF